MLKTLDIINTIVSFLVFIPILVLLMNYNKTKEMKPVLLYLIVCFFVEFLSIYFRYILDQSFRELGITFILFETIFVIIYFSDYYSKLLYSILISFLSIYVLIFFIELFGVKSNLINLLFGGSKFIILIITLNNILQGFRLEIKSWLRYLNFGFFIFSLINATTYSFISFFELYKEYLQFYLILISLSNLILYSFITLSIYKCKNQSI